METNLTRARRIVFAAADTNPVPGHHLVVFERLGAGQAFRQVLTPGERIKLRWCERPDLMAYAVSASPQLRHSFSRSCVHREQQHTYVLHFVLELAVSDPRLMVDQVESDPLQRLEDETAKLFDAAIRRLPWEIIEREADDLQRDALHRGHADLAGRARSNLEALQVFAAGIGFELADVAISRSLPQAAFAGLSAKEQARQQEMVRTAEHQGEVQEKLFRRELALLDVATEETLGVRRTLAVSVSEVIRRLASEVRSMPDVEEILPRLEGILERVRHLPLNDRGSGDEPRALVSPPARTLLAAPRPCGSALAELAGSAIELRGGEGPEGAARRRLVAAMLHLLAEASLDAEADPNLITRESSRVREQFQLLLPSLDDRQVSLLRRFQDVAALRTACTAEEAVDA